MPRSSSCLVLFAVIALSACAAVDTMDGAHLRVGSEDFRRYVESVFRLQNKTATDLAFALEAGDLAAADLAALNAAEQSLLDACSGLNEIAASRRDNESMGKLRQLRAARSAPQCEVAARAAQTSLQRHAD